MRTPLGIGLVVGLLILLTLVALAHLAFSPRRTGRWGWLFAIALVPVAGPLLYLLFGRRSDDEDWDDLAASRAYAPAYVPVAHDEQPAPETLAAPPVSPFQADLDAPSLPETPFRHEHLPAGDMPVEELAYDTLPDFTVRDADPLSDAPAPFDDEEMADAQGTSQDTPRPATVPDVFLADLSHSDDAPGPHSAPTPGDAAHPVMDASPDALPDAAPEALPEMDAPKSPAPTASARPAEEARTEAPAPAAHLRARRRKPR